MNKILQELLKTKNELEEASRRNKWLEDENERLKTQKNTGDGGAAHTHHLDGGAQVVRLVVLAELLLLARGLALGTRGVRAGDGLGRRDGGLDVNRGAVLGQVHVRVFRARHGE